MLEARTKGGKLGWRNALRRRPSYAWFDQATGVEDLSCFIGGGIGDEGAPIALGADQTFKRQRLQGSTHNGTADIEERADLGLVKLGSGRQAAIHDRVAQLIADHRRAIFRHERSTEILIDERHEASDAHS